MMWAHFCECERGLIWVADGKPCNWCDVCQFICDDAGVE